MCLGLNIWRESHYDSRRASGCAPQAFSAGVGNWVADEVLYQARIHPEQKASTLGEEQAGALHAQLQGVLQARPASQPCASTSGTVSEMMCTLQFNIHARSMCYTHCACQCHAAWNM